LLESSKHPSVRLGDRVIPIGYRVDILAESESGDDIDAGAVERRQDVDRFSLGLRDLFGDDFAQLKWIGQS